MAYSFSQSPKSSRHCRKKKNNLFYNTEQLDSNLNISIFRIFPGLRTENIFFV